MKILKFLIIALVAVCSFASAEAQVRINVNTGHRRPVYHRRVVRRHVVRHHRVYRRPVRPYRHH